MSLNPSITKESSGKLTLHWTPDPAAKGYLITTPTGSAIAGASRSSSNLGVHDSITVTISPLVEGVVEQAAYPAPPPNLFGWLPGDPVPAPPAGTPKVTRLTDLTALLHGGTGIWDARGLTGRIPGRTIIDAQDLTVYLDPGLVFSRSGLRTDPAVEAIGCVNVMLWGGAIENANGPGFNARAKSMTQPLKDFAWYDFQCANTASGAISAHSNTGPVDGLDLRGSYTSWGTDASFEPSGHSPGTGIQGAYIGQNPATGGKLRNVKLALHAHDCQQGSALQWSHLDGYEFWLLAENLRTDAVPAGTLGTWGNALSPFDGTSDNGVVHYVEARNVRQVLHQAGSGGAGGSLVIEKGRSAGVSGSPAYDVLPGTVLEDVT